MVREVDLLARVKPPKVICLELCFFTHNDKGQFLCYVRFSLYAGGLEEWRKKPQALDSASMHKRLIGALRALQHVHCHGVVHCEPRNVLLAEMHADGLQRAVLADFDLCVDPQTRLSNSVSRVLSSFARGPRGTPGGADPCTGGDAAE